MGADFTIHVFSNVAAPDPGRNLSSLALASALALARGGRVAVRYFVDPEPHPAHLGQWVDAARDGSPVDFDVVETNGLASGFAASLRLCETPFALQLEHDFVLYAHRIPHSLTAMAEAMAAGGVRYLRFNKRWNRAAGSDLFMTPQTVPGLPCCRVSGRSNNPHILDIADARRLVLPLINPEARKARGLEGYIDQFVGGGHVYGDLGHPATAGHLDGRGVHARDARRRRAALREARTAT